MRPMKLLAGALAGICLVSASTVSLFASAEQSDSDISAVIEKILGDPSGDGAINAVDASYILEMYSEYSISPGEFSDEILAVCDVNKDGAVNAMDASYVLSYYVDQSMDNTDISIEDFINNIISEAQKLSQFDISEWDPWASDVPNPWDPASSYDPTLSSDLNVDWESWLPEGFLNEDNPWTWPPAESANPWSPINDPENWGSWFDQPLQEIDGSWFENALKAIGIDENE